MASSIITEICIDRLFDRFSYRLPAANGFSNAAILYGDNGVGKSTILRLVFHLLSSSGNRGHRTRLKNIAFQMLSVSLSSGYKIKAERKPAPENNEDFLLAPLLLTIEQDGKLVAEWSVGQDREEGGYTSNFDAHYIVSQQDFAEWAKFSEVDFSKMTPAQIRRFALKVKPRARLDDGVRRGEKHYIEILSSIAPTVFYVNAERRLDSDAVADPSDELELRRAITHHEPKRINDLVNRAREIALSQAMLSASRWVQRRAVQSANQGSTNVHSVYVNVLQHLSNDSYKQSAEKERPDLGVMVGQLESIEVRTRQLEEYELATALDMSVFKASLQSAFGEQRDLSAELIRPYIQSVLSRLDAQAQIYEILSRFVGNINRFLNGKTLHFRLTQGFSIKTSNTKLEPSQLSSGEQQLILMFCYALTARDSPSVFMIDEPEISLNVKWQRQLLQSLIEVTSGSEIQFILASHSLELISQHRDKVVKLENIQ